MTVMQVFSKPPTFKTHVYEMAVADGCELIFEIASLSRIENRGYEENSTPCADLADLLVSI
ncbi:hypothetical protein J1614_012207 [Plenodomus biglobosus]|nr:hypothetical protein J1614_012207 [Plenodomus biglobosus]